MIDDHDAARPDPNTRPCADCGHIWFVGERRHEYDDHGSERPVSAEILCVLCRRERALRGADRRDSDHWA